MLPAAGNGDVQAHTELRSQAGHGGSTENAPASKRRRIQDTQHQPPQNVAPVDQGFQQAAPTLRKKKRKAAQNRSQLAVPCTTNGTELADLGNSKRVQKKARKAELAEDSSLRPTRKGNGFCSEELQQSITKPATGMERVAQPSQMTSGALRTTQNEAWWGASRFVSSGCLEGLEKTQQVPSSESRAFTEDTQANLYNRTQAAKTAGKQGLGIGQGGPLTWCPVYKLPEELANSTATNVGLLFLHLCNMSCKMATHKIRGLQKAGLEDAVCRQGG